MKFANAAKGVKKIFVAEVLTLISLLAVLVAAVLVLTSHSAFTLESAIGILLVIGTAVLCIASCVMLIVAFIMKLVGMINASHDESSFKSALIFFIVSMVLSIVAGVLGSVSAVAGSILALISNLGGILVLVFIIAGIIRLSDRLNRGDISVKGSKVLKLLVVIKVIVLIATAVVGFMSGFSNSIIAIATAVVDFVSSFSDSTVAFGMSLVTSSEGGSSPSIAVGIILFAVQVLGLIRYFIYLPFLSQAKKMLNKA